MNEVTKRGDRRMTVREVAEALGVSPDTVYNSAKELFPDLFSPGKTTYLDEKQVTAVKMNLRKNSELAAVLAIPHLGQNNFYRKLREDGYIDRFNHPYRQHVESGLMYEKEYYVPHLDETKTQLRITQKGVAYFARKYGVKAAV
jgi:phage antirepressor YoqD-like protein